MATMYSRVNRISDRAISMIERGGMMREMVRCATFLVKDAIVSTSGTSTSEDAGIDYVLKNTPYGWNIGDLYDSDLYPLMTLEDRQWEIRNKRADGAVEVVLTGTYRRQNEFPEVVECHSGTVEVDSSKDGTGGDISIALGTSGGTTIGYAKIPYALFIRTFEWVAFVANPWTAISDYYNKTSPDGNEACIDVSATPILYQDNGRGESKQIYAYRMRATVAYTTNPYKWTQEVMYSIGGMRLGDLDPTYRKWVVLYGNAGTVWPFPNAI